MAVKNKNVPSRRADPAEAILLGRLRSLAEPAFRGMVAVKNRNHPSTQKNATFGQSGWRQGVALRNELN